ncbi:RHS repeat protein [Photorhabdus temperata]|uniref:RHS repeat-associated core protein n=1 Tax=Photorhabdus temperata subsp. temperata Meg1 TaxID=1393735 RepID=A0A081RT48_PHOTE|nr:RHS repeat domain-containing protein [Photorhabdus temperata]KER01851.1 RHS repeat-associated core protein [Photorhabdus temperata subsp. temperata Meg1]
MTSFFNPATFAGTPTVSVRDNRGLTVREISFHRTTAGGDTDPRITRHQYDAYGYRTQSIDPRLYDAMQTDSSVKPNFTWQYNLTGNILSTESVDAGHTVTLNDIEGRPVLTKTSTKVIQTRQYEAASLPGRLLSVTEQVSGEATARVTERLIWSRNTQEAKDHNLVGQCVNHYDTAGLTQLESRSLTGTVLSQSRQLLSDSHQADWKDDNQATNQSRLNSEAYTTQSAFDATGALLMQTDTKGNIQRLTYNIAGQLNSSKLTVKGQSEQIIVKSLSYSAAGQKLQEIHGNGVVTEYTYEPETQRLISITTLRTSDNKVLQDLRYEYDPVGNVVNIRNSAEATRFWRNQKVVPKNTYSYDSLYQLIEATGREMANIGQYNNLLPSPVLLSDSNTYTKYIRTYTYDRGGNLTRIQHSSPAIQGSYTTQITVSNRSNRAVWSTLTDNPMLVDDLFDAGGHQNTLVQGHDLSWDTRGQLQQVTQTTQGNNINSDREWYRYGSDGIRLLKVSEQQTLSPTYQQRVIYLPGLELRTTQDSAIIKQDLQVITVGEAGRAQVRILHWETKPPADIKNNQVRYSYDNLTGSSQLELDHEGRIISHEEYYPFGGTALWAVRNQTEASYKFIRYSGKERDATGLYYYGYRYYQPWVGRWLSADPAGTADGVNLYRMVRNNPVTLHDPDGLAPEQWHTREAFKQLPFSEHSLGTRDELAPKISGTNSLWHEAYRGPTKERETSGLFNELPFAEPKVATAEEINLHGITTENVTVYRVEVAQQSERFLYTGITGTGGVKIAIPNRNSEHGGKEDYLNKTMPGEAQKRGGWYQFSKNYIAANKGKSSGNLAFYNFGNPRRALQFYEQKTENPKEKLPFVIKSFEIPAAVFKAIAEDAILEKDYKKFPTAPMNVDVAAFNQLGLQPHHVDLLVGSIVPKSGRVYSENEHWKLMDKPSQVTSRPLLRGRR